MARAGPEVSVVIPARNEEGNIPELLREVKEAFSDSGFSYEIVLVDDNSTDSTPKICDRLSGSDRRVRCVHRLPPPGFGRAVKDGLKASKGKIVVLVMGDRSDQPKDIVAVVSKAREGVDVVYGSRFCAPGLVNDYPPQKMLSNRLFNNVARLLFSIPEKDITNAFKAYRREVLDAIGLDSIESKGFDITIELPVRACLLGFSKAEVPVHWIGRRAGFAKMNVLKVGLPYGIRLISLLKRKYLGGQR